MSSLAGLAEVISISPCVAFQLLVRNETPPRPLIISPERYYIIKELIPDYRILLIDPHQMNDEDLRKFNSKLGTVLTFIKNSNDKQKLSEKFGDNSDEELDVDSVMVINSCTGSNIPLPEKNEVIKVCKAIEEIRNDCRMETQAEMIEALKENGVSDEVIQATLKTMQEKAQNK